MESGKEGNNQRGKKKKKGRPRGEKNTAEKETLQGLGCAVEISRWGKGGGEREKKNLRGKAQAHRPSFSRKQEETTPSLGKLNKTKCLGAKKKEALDKPKKEKGRGQKASFLEWEQEREGGAVAKRGGKRGGKKKSF